jgi:hypothetical protein
MKQFDSIWIVWLIAVCIWNFGWPEVHPIADVVVAVVLSIGAYQIKNYKK